MPIYEYVCRKCDLKFEEYSNRYHEIMTHPCPYCKPEVGDRVYSLSTPKIFDSFTTNNIIADGTPVKVQSQSQLSQLQAEHGVRMVDDDYRPPQTQFPL